MSSAITMALLSTRTLIISSVNRRRITISQEKGKKFKNTICAGFSIGNYIGFLLIAYGRRIFFIVNFIYVLFDLHSIRLKIFTLLRYCYYRLLFCNG